MKVLRCRDAGYDCNKVMVGETDEEIMRQAADHARNDHHLEVTPELAEKIKSLIHEEEHQAT